METFNVKILELRKRLGIKAIEAPSVEEAEENIVKLLSQYLNLETSLKRRIYIIRSTNEIKLKLLIDTLKFSIQLEKQ